MINEKTKGGEKMRIEFYAKNVYGKTNLYIKNEEAASIVRTLTGKITVDAYELAALIKLGCEVVEVNEKTTEIPTLKA